MIRIREAIIVEGRYDKNTLAQIVDAPILETSGFGIFHDRQRLALLRRLASKAARQRLLAQLDLPEHLSTNALLEVLNALMTREEFQKLYI